MSQRFEEEHRKIEADPQHVFDYVRERLTSQGARRRNKEKPRGFT